jgi:hypothetical protein
VHNEGRSYPGFNLFDPGDEALFLGIARGEMMTLFVPLVSNCWSSFTRLSTPNQRAEAINPRPLLLLHPIGRKTTHSNQSTLTLTSLHAEANKIQVAMRATRFLNRIRAIAEQLKPVERWRLILLAVVRAFPLTRAMEMPPAGFQTA